MRVLAVVNWWAAVGIEPAGQTRAAMMASVAWPLAAELRMNKDWPADAPAVVAF